MTPRDPCEDRPELPHRFENVPPPAAFSGERTSEWVAGLKESRWNSDYQTEFIKSYLGVKAVDDITFSDHRCSLAYSIIIRYSIPDFVKEQGFTIDRVVGLENDGEYAPSFTNIELTSDKSESRLFYGNYFVSNSTDKFVIHLEEGYSDDFKFRVAARRGSTISANKLMEELIKYAKSHNFLIGKKIDPHCNFIKFDKQYTWDDLILPEKIKDDIRRNLSNLIDFRDLYRKNNLQIKRGLIFSGEPGSGKSTVGKILCNTIGWTFMWVTPKHLENSKKVAGIVNLCRDLSPTVLFLEDIDLYAASRESNSNPAVLGELMNQLDGIQENTDIITIATTNKKEILEKALLDRPGRFDKVIEFPKPAEAERKSMFENFSKGLIVDVDFEKLSKEATKGMTGAQIREVVNLAVIYAVDVKSYDEEKRIILKNEHFHAALKTVKGKDFSKLGFLPESSSRLLDFDD